MTALPVTKYTVHFSSHMENRAHANEHSGFPVRRILVSGYIIVPMTMNGNFIGISIYTLGHN